MKQSDFPFFSHHPELVYFDNAATTHKPWSVIKRIEQFYITENAPVYRSVYSLAEHATCLYEESRRTLRAFIGAQDCTEIVFTNNATHSANIVAFGWGRYNLHPGDEIIVTELDHHSHVLPWQVVAQERGCTLRWAPVKNNGELDYEAIEQLITSATKVVAISAVSNVTGTEVDIKRIVALAHRYSAVAVVDASQYAPHKSIDVRSLGCDFLYFSGHKMMGPTGSGILYVNKACHEQMHPYMYGGGMVLQASKSKSTWREMPYLLEAGSPPLAQIVGLAAAVEYLQEYIHGLAAYEANLCKVLIDGLQKYNQVKIIGSVDELKRHGHLVSFVVNGMHGHDIAQVFADYNIAVRSGHHCAQPLHEKLGISSSLRVSFYGYNTLEEVERFLTAFAKIMQ